MNKSLFLSALGICMASVAFAQKPEKVDTTLISKIKKEGFERSQVMDIMSMLTDVNGPRLTNSPGYAKAAEYVKSTLTSWGLQNAHLDTWDEEFGRGWSIKKFSLQNLSPVYTSVIAYPKAWSPGIKGTVQAEVVYLDVNKEADLEKYKGKLKGKIVLFDKPVETTATFTPDGTRFTDSELLEMANAGPVAGTQGGFRPGGGSNLPFAKWDFLQKEGALAVLEPSPLTRQQDGTILVSAATIPYAANVPFTDRVRAQSGNAPKILPQIVVASEHYNRMVRQLLKGQVIKSELTYDVEFTALLPALM
jgi:carboxypeptidase Q